MTLRPAAFLPGAFRRGAVRLGAVRPAALRHGALRLASIVALAVSGVLPVSAEPGFWLLAEDAAGLVEARGFPASESGRLADIFARLPVAAALPAQCRPSTPDAFETLPTSDRTEALRGLTAIGLDLTGLPPPPGMGEDFGRRVHAAVAGLLAAEGLATVAPDDSARLPGQPRLQIFLSYSDRALGCDYAYSLFASLTQTAVLTRDPGVKLPVGVWSFSAKSGEGRGAGQEELLLIDAAEALLRDWNAVNGPP
ncbi:MAG: hypothetical protein RLZZ528_2372 [Pseudomonadota bacterium]